MLTILKRDYVYTITDEPDGDFIKYISRKLNVSYPMAAGVAGSYVRLDISLDDDEGDVFAGIAAYTHDGILTIELLWVDPNMRGDGIGAHLVALAEREARRRGCSEARIQTHCGADFYRRMGYRVIGRLALIGHDSEAAMTRLAKTLSQVAKIQKDTA